MGLMGSMYVGTSGLQTSQNALNTTAHNMSNLDTTGYTRQQVALGTRQYNTLSKNSCATSYTQLGLGVAYSQTRQVRDYFLDKNYRRESGRSMFYETSANTLTQVEDILGESNEGKSFQITMADLWTAVEELSKDPTSKVNQNLFITRCDEFIQRAQGVYDSLATYQLDMNADVKQSVDRINEIAQRVDVLNNAIMKIETAGIEHANDLKDERNGLLDELGKYGNISWSEDEYGAVNIAFEGVDLLKNGMFNEIDIYQDPQTEFYIPFWAKNARYEYNEEGQKLVVPESIQDALIYDLYRPVSSEINTDIGGLRATLLARGDHKATYADVADKEFYDREISQSILMNVEAEFDQLVHSITTAINNVLKEAAETAQTKFPGTDYLMRNGEPIQIFQLTLDENGYTTENIVINMELRQNPSLLGFRLPDGSEDAETMEKLTHAFHDESYILNPNVATKVNFQRYYSTLVNQVASSASVYGTIEASQQDTVNSLSSAREQVLGVSSDEELSNMIMYQNAFNAASRYINVISEMLEHLVTNL